jgi:hypothetical protein
LARLICLDLAGQSTPVQPSQGVLIQPKIHPAQASPEFINNQDITRLDAGAITATRWRDSAPWVALRVSRHVTDADYRLLVKKSTAADRHHRLRPAARP